MLSHFPVQLTSFVGRTGEIHSVLTLLNETHCRLLTLLGPGGTGKTRLSIEVAHRRAAQLCDGAVFVALQPLHAPEYVVHIIGQALGIRVLEGDSILDSLVNILQKREILLVLDNAEHLLDAVTLLVELLERTPTLQVLVTSREVLNIAGEQIYEVGGMTLSANTLENSDAVQLFITRATQARYDFDARREQQHIFEICQLTGGLPLALELAASWTRSLSCAEIAREIRQNVDFLATTQKNVPDRHRNLRAVFEQSWDRLNDLQREIFSRLTVFSGHFTREAAEIVTGATLHTLSALVDQSLLQVVPAGRYTLHSLLRQYAEEPLHQNETRYYQLHTSHAVYYLGLVQQLDSQIKSTGQIQALHILDGLLDNIRQAWHYAVEQHRSDLITSSFEALALYYQMRCRLAEGYEMFAYAAEHFASDETLLAAMLLLAKSWFMMFGGADEEAFVLTTREKAMSILSKQTMPGLGAMFLRNSRSLSNELKRLLAENETAYLARGDDWGLAWTISQCIPYHERTTPDSIMRLEQSLAYALRCGDRWGATWTQAILGLIAEEKGNYKQAFELYKLRLVTCQEVGDTGGIAWSLQQLAKVSLEQNDTLKAIYYSHESLRIALAISSGNSVNEAIWRISFIHQKQGQLERAVELLSALYNSRETYISRKLRAELEAELTVLRSQLSQGSYLSAVEAGKRWLPRQLGETLLHELETLLGASLPHPRDDVSVRPESLSEREQEVLQLVADGLSNNEIAQELVVTVGTVKKHLNNIFGKLGVQRRTQALLRAKELGLINS